MINNSYQESHIVDYIFLHTYKEDFANPKEYNIFKYIISEVANVLLFEIFEKADFSPEDYFQNEILQKIEKKFQKIYKGTPEDYEAYEYALHEYIEDIYSEPDNIYIYIEDKINNLIENEWKWIKAFKEFNLKDREENLVKMEINFSFKNIDLFNNLEEETISNLENMFIETLNKYLQESMYITHIIKFKDEIAFNTNLNLLPKIYEIEMDLRNVITFILLETFQNKNPYNLLEDFNIDKFKRVDNNQDYSAEDLSENLENELFLLSFTNYKKFMELNNYDVDKGIKVLKEILRQKDNISFNALKFLKGIKNLSTEEYSQLKRRFTPEGITFEKYKDFILGLEQYMHIIEIVRNSVAHNRHLTDDIISNFETAYNGLKSHIQDFWDNIEQYLNDMG